MSYLSYFIFYNKRVDKYGLKKAIETPKRKMRSKKL